MSARRESRSGFFVYLVPNSFFLVLCESCEGSSSSQIGDDAKAQTGAPFGKIPLGTFSTRACKYVGVYLDYSYSATYVWCIDFLWTWFDAPFHSQEKRVSRRVTEKNKEEGELLRLAAKGFFWSYCTSVITVRQAAVGLGNEKANNSVVFRSPYTTLSIHLTMRRRRSFSKKTGCFM